MFIWGEREKPNQLLLWLLLLSLLKDFIFFPPTRGDSWQVSLDARQQLNHWETNNLIIPTSLCFPPFWNWVFCFLAAELIGTHLTFHLSETQLLSLFTRPLSLSLSLSEKISKENKASSFKLNKKNEFQQAMLGILPAFHRDLCMRKTSSFAFPPLLLLTFFFLFLINTFLNIKHAVKRLARVTPSPSHHRIQEISYFYFFLKWTHPFTLQYSQAPPTKSLNYSQTLSSLSPILQI